MTQEELNQKIKEIKEKAQQKQRIANNQQAQQSYNHMAMIEKALQNRRRFIDDEDDYNDVDDTFENQIVAQSTIQNPSSGFNLL